MQIDRLTKHYGRIRAVDSLTLDIPVHSVFGILGPNGSGKTTTLGMLLDVINPTSGNYNWFGGQSNHQNLKRIGSILETPAFYPYLSADSNLRIISEIKGAGKENIDEVLRIVGLFERRHSSFRTYSLGMKQRLAVAAALLTDPEVLILDEPTNGLDPKGIAEIRDLIRSVAAQGKTVMLASHLLDEVQKVCTHFAVLYKGRLMHKGLVGEVSDEYQQIALAADDLDGLALLLDSYPGKVDLKRETDHVVVTLPLDGSASGLNRFVFENGLTLNHLVSLKKSLESQFLEILNDAQ